MDEPIDLSTLASHFTCKLCKGYLIEATTIIECLHSFCKSCIVRYLDDDNRCPTCQMLIHQSHPLSYIMLDRKMQDIVYKAVPRLQAREEERIKKFYLQRNIPVPQQESKLFKSSSGPMSNEGDTVNGTLEDLADKGSNCNYHRNDQQVSVVMSEGDSLPALRKKYIHCSIYTTIMSLKRYVSHHIYGNMEEHNSLDIFCQKELMGKDHSLEFVLKTRWRSKEPPLQLEYRERVDVI